MPILIIAILIIVGFVAGIIYLSQEAEERQKKLDEARKKKPSEWTKEDRELLLANLEANRQFLTFQQYDVLKAKYTGTTSATEILTQGGRSLFEIDKMNTASTGNIQGKTKANATKTIIKDAIVGGVIAGETGAVVGAIVGKSKVDNNSSNSK